MNSQRVTGSTSLTGIVLTYNEEQNLPACLESLAGLVSALFVVDSGSQDRTVEIAQSHGAHVLHHPFESHASQWRWALEQLSPHTDWVLALDADQRLTGVLHDEIRRLFGSELLQRFGYAGFYLNRRQIFRGRWLRHGGYYPKYLLKMFRLSTVEIDDRDLMDHHFYVRGRVGKLTGDILEDNQKESDISFWIRKHAGYAELHAREELIRRSDARPWLIQPTLRGTPDERVAWLKERWYSLPLYVRPFLYFFFRYVVQLGFLDGKEGFVFHFLQAFWYRLIVDIKLDDLQAETRSSGRRSASGAHH